MTHVFEEFDQKHIGDVSIKIETSWIPVGQKGNSWIAV